MVGDPMPMVCEPRQAPLAAFGHKRRLLFPERWLSRTLQALTLLVVVNAAACDRLNPDWCSTAGRCSSGEYCDPSTNTCRRREAGVSDAAGDRVASDWPRFEHDPCAITSSGYTCVGGAVVRCTDGGLTRLRNCPGGDCAYGHCQTPSPPILHCNKNSDCIKPNLCTMLLNAAGTPENMCAAPVAGSQPGACTSGLDCSSGLCTPSSQCYYACDVAGDCPSNYQCMPGINLLVEGVVVTSKSCEHP
jgi:hypothetical protein